MNKNIPIGWTVAAIAVVIILAFLLSKNRPIQDDTALKVLREQNQSLKDEVKRLEKEYQALDLYTQESKREDSIKLAQYEARIYRDYQTIQNLKNKRDEAVKNIGGADDDELRRILSGHQ